MTTEKPEVVEGGTMASRLPSRPDEAETVQRASQGDKDALILLYESHIDRVYRHLYSKVGNTAEAEDLTSETFIRAIEAIMHGQYSWQGKPFGAWLFAIATHILQERRRKLRGLPLIENKEEQAVLWDLVKKLPIAEQQVLIMRHVYCLPMNYSCAKLSFFSQ